MKTHMIAAAALTVLPVFSASAEDKGVLDYVREQADLFSYQLETTQDYCLDLAQNVLPALNELELTQKFSAVFDRDLVQCDIHYGDRVIEELRGESLFSLNREFDSRQIAFSIMRALNTDERVKVSEHLALPSM